MLRLVSQNCLKIFQLAAFFTMATGWLFAAKEDSRPNILIVLCDDLGYSDVGFNGSKDIITPELDQLAENGVICTSGYVAHPFCGPSRMAMMAGRYPHEFGGQFNHPSSHHGIEQWDELGIDVNEVLISSVLKQAGYFTGAVGKWHLGHAEPYHPNNRGFDDYYGFLGGGHKYFPDEFKAQYEHQKRNGVELINDYLLPLEHNGVEVDEKEYITDALTRETVRMIQDAEQQNKPFFIFLAYNAPHVPLEAKEEDMAHFQSIDDEKRRTYAGMVYAVDRGVGRIVETLKSTGDYENTLIVFLSDNGGKLIWGANNDPLREGKGSAFEGGVRVPMFFHWPNGLKANQKYDEPVTALDFYPTFAKMAEAKIPEGKHLDGIDVMDGLQTGHPLKRDQMIMVMRHRLGFSDIGGRRGPWKVSRVGKSSPWKLYNLDSDISESHDLSARHPEMVKSMISELEKWSGSHVEPRWFHIWKEGQEWEMHHMPDFETRFETY